MPTNNQERCKWCHYIITKEEKEKHEENCDMNDGGRQEMNEEEIANHFYN